MIPNEKIYKKLSNYKKYKFKSKFIYLLSKEQFEFFLDCYGSKNEEDFLNTLDWIVENTNNTQRLSVFNSL